MKTADLQLFIQKNRIKNKNQKKIVVTTQNDDDDKKVGKDVGGKRKRGDNGSDDSNQKKKNHRTGNPVTDDEQETGKNVATSLRRSKRIEGTLQKGHFQHMQSSEKRLGQSSTLPEKRKSKEKGQVKKTMCSTT